MLLWIGLVNFCSFCNLSSVVFRITSKQRLTFWIICTSWTICVIGVNLLLSAKVQSQCYGIAQEQHSDSSHVVANICSYTRYAVFTFEKCCAYCVNINCKYCNINCVCVTHVSTWHLINNYPKVPSIRMYSTSEMNVTLRYHLYECIQLPKWTLP